MLLLLLPGLLYCLAPVVANRIEPRVVGVPFLVTYLIAVTILTGPLIWLVARLDPAYRSGAAEFVPADDPSEAATGFARLSTSPPPSENSTPPRDSSERAIDGEDENPR
ncbi:DUF3311 domain-containing protein [Nocardia sp. NPDC004722]